MGTQLRLHPDWDRPLSWLGALATYIAVGDPHEEEALHIDAREPSLPRDTVREMVTHACDYLSEGRDFAEVVLVEDPVELESGVAVGAAEEVAEALGRRPRALLEDSVSIVLHGRWAKRLIDDVQAMRDGALFELTPEPSYAEPLVSVRIPTFGAVELLTERALPSVLTGGYRNIEVIVCSDGPQPHARAAVEAVDDPRVRYVELPERPVYPNRPTSFWQVAGSRAMNRLIEEARGDFQFPLDHDDAFTVDHVLALLEAMRRGPADFAFGQAITELVSGAWISIGSAPLRHAQIVHASLGYSRRLAHMRYDADCWLINEPADWNLWRRMAAAGARVAHVAQPVAVHFREGSSIAGREVRSEDVLDDVAHDVVSTSASELLDVASEARGARFGAPAGSRRVAPRRRPTSRRLAVVDTRFPWSISGFRWHEARSLLAALPETIFFATEPTGETWRRPVYPLADFDSVASELGVTDVYAVFLNLVLALTGLDNHPDAASMGGIPRGFAVGEAIASRRLHVTLYPGGGLVADTSHSLLREVSDRCSTVFSNIAEVLDAVPAAIWAPVGIPTDFYEFRKRAAGDVFRVVFAADDRPRKGLDTLLAALPMFGAGVHAHIVGPHERYAGAIPPELATFHGVLEPDALRGLYWAADAFVSPVRPEGHDGAPGEAGVIDGFPTTTACDALATGCALLHSNPRGDHRVFEAGVHYIEIPERDPVALADGVRLLAADRRLRDELAARGAGRLCEVMDVDVVRAAKLEAMGLAAAGRS